MGAVLPRSGRSLASRRMSQKVSQSFENFAGSAFGFARLVCYIDKWKILCIYQLVLKRSSDFWIFLYFTKGNPVTSYHMKTLLLYECEKHPREAEWDEPCLGDRINGILLQLISCLQCRRCPHYFLPNLDLFKGKSPSALENAAKQAWRLTRELLTNTRSLEKL